MHSNVVYLAVNNSQKNTSKKPEVIEDLGKFEHVSEAIASFNARFNTFEHALVAYQSNHEQTAITRLYHINSDQLLAPTLH